jgi:hypothetical protein
VVYWGDLDTHGFAILNQLCAWLPQTRSLLTDRDTPMAHRIRWVAEASPAVSQLNRLTRWLPVSARSQPEVVLAGHAPERRAARQNLIARPDRGLTAAA